MDPPAPDLNGFAPVYRTGSTRRASTVVVVVFLLLGACVSGVFVVLGHDDWVPWVFVAVGPQVVIQAITSGRRTTSRIDDRGVASRGVFGLREVPWHEVASIRVGRRWDRASTAVLRHGGDLPLWGLPREAATDLSERVATWRRAAHPGPVARPGPAAGPLTR